VQEEWEAISRSSNHIGYLGFVANRRNAMKKATSEQRQYSNSSVTRVLSLRKPKKIEEIIIESSDEEI
jgi:hypothetical protein